MKVLFLCQQTIDCPVGGMAEVLHYLPLSLKKLGVEVVIYNENKRNAPHGLSDPILLKNG